MIIKCPSGLSFEARTWKIGDRKHLHDQQVLRQGLLMRKMLEAVDQGVTEPGPYALEAGQKVNWANAALVDVLDALLDIRVETKPLLDYNENCESCRAIIPLTIDLRELSRTPMSEEAKAHLASNEPISKMLAAEEGGEEAVEVKMRLLRGKDMSKISQHYKQDPTGIAEVQMCLHIASITPLGCAEIEGLAKVREFYQDQSWYFHTALDDVVASFSGGVNTTVKSYCNQCHAEQESVIPFGAEFFYPRKKHSISSMATL